MKHLLLFILTMTLFASVYAQPLQWTKGFTGNSNIYAVDIVVSPEGSSYATGQFTGQIDFDPGAGTFNLNSISGVRECYIVKLDSDGNFAWAKQIQMASWTPSSIGTSVALDDSGYVYIAGEFKGTGDFDPGVGTHNLTSNGEEDIFLLKLDSLGNFIYALQIGSADEESAEYLTIDNDNNIFLAGAYSSTVDFDPQGGIHNLTANVDGDIYVLKLDAQANFQWCRTFGVYGQQNDFPRIDHDNSGNTMLGVRLNNKMCLVKLDNQGTTSFIKSIDNPGSQANVIKGIAVDNLGNILAAGTYYASTDFDPGAGTFNLNSTGAEDVFILKLDNNGNFAWVKGIGGIDYEIVEDVKIDVANSVYITGSFSGTVDFDPNQGTYNQSTIPTQVDDWSDIFVLKLSEHGDFLAVSQMGGKDIDEGRAIDIDAVGNCYITGVFRDTCDFDPGPGNVSLVANGFNTAAFAVKLSSTLGLNEQPQNIAQIQVYPNPVTNEFYISATEVIHTIVITDMLGKVVYSLEPENYLNRIDLDVTPGIYNVSMHVGDEAVVKKVMVQ